MDACRKLLSKRLSVVFETALIAFLSFIQKSGKS